VLDVELEELGQRIRQCWVEEQRNFSLRTSGAAGDWGEKHMTKWDGGTDSLGKEHASVWLKIARFCMDNNLEPFQLIRAMFYDALPALPPRPNQAHGNYALEKYRHFTSPGTYLEIKNLYTSKFETQKQYVTSNVFSRIKYSGRDEITAWKLAITEKGAPLSPLFRYCVAINQGWTDIASMYAEKARVQYLYSPKLYDAVWQEWIPNTLKEKVDVNKRT
jgi:hypothetical protein